MKAGISSRIKQSLTRWRINDAAMHIMLWPKALVDRIFPQAAGVQRFYGLAMTGVKIIILYGWRSFWRRFIYYRKTEKNISRLRTHLAQGIEQQQVFQIKPEQLLPVEKLKVAVIVHAFYPDLFAEICSYLKNMPCPYALLISVRNEVDMQVINRQLDDLPMLKKSVIKIVKNRGRDIGPFLVDFAPELGEFDYICKIHTKKSLYSGADGIEWRRYLHQMLLGSKHRIQAILTVFSHDESTGIIYPVRYEKQPYWRYTWLSNKWIAAPFVNRLGIDFDPDEYLDFPAGSMFWIKREALKPLLDMRLTLNDFPAENGRDEGTTLQHVIERCFSLSAQAAGLRPVMINGLKDDIFSYTDATKISTYFNMASSDQVRDALPLVDVVSFDIFDTLLCRPFATPDMFFRYLEELVEQRYGIKNFMHLRRQAETEIRIQQGPAGDAKISAVYEELARLAHISPAVADEILELEIKTEIDLLIPRQDIIESFKAVKKSGKRIILTDDTCFERPQIERILKSKGIQGYHELYLSGEEGKRKDRGDMWDHVLMKEGITGSNFLHIGDNEQSDIQKLFDRGPYFIVHIMKPSILFRQSTHGRYLWQMFSPRKGWRENLLYGMISNHFCLNTYPYKFWHEDKPLSDPFSLGYTVFGPLIHNFLTWLVNYARLDGIKHLSFLSREGYLLHKIYQDIAGSATMKQAGLSLPTSNYLLSSRRAALFATLQKTEDLLPFLDRDFSGTLRYFFEKRLNVSAPNMPAIESALGEDVLNRQISLPADYDMLREILLHVFDVLVPQAESERGALLAYCRDNGMNGREKSGLVDIGYSCTIQRSLINLLGIPLNGYYFSVDDTAGKIHDRNSQARGYLGELVDPTLDTIVMFNHILLLEAVLTAPQGQLLCFSKGKDGVVPVFKQPGIAQKRFDVISHIQDGIIAFVMDMLDLFGIGSFDVNFPVSGLLYYYQMIATGRVDIGHIKTALSVEDEYSGLPEIDVIDYYTQLYEHNGWTPNRV